MTPEQVGGLCAFLIFTMPSVAFIALAFRSKSRPRSLSNASLGCGLAVFPLCGIFVAVRETGDAPDSLNFVLGGLTILAAALGIGFAVWSLIIRRSQDG